MATKPAEKATDTKPAVRTKKPADKPANEKPANDGGVTLKDLATDLGGKDPKALRARIRKLKGGAQVGQGGRYRWNNKSDPEYKELLAQLSPKSE